MRNYAFERVCINRSSWWRDHNIGVLVRYVCKMSTTLQGTVAENIRRSLNRRLETAKKSNVPWEDELTTKPDWLMRLERRIPSF